MNIFSFIPVSGTYTLQAGWNSVLIIPVGSVQIVNNASPAQSITITSPLALGDGGSQYDQLIINGTATLVSNGAATASSDAAPGFAIWGAITGNPVNQSDVQNATIQGTFTPANSVVLQNDTFKIAFQKLQGQVSAAATVVWGVITGTPSNQTDLQNGTIQGVFTPVNSAVVTADSFKTGFQKTQGQLNNILTTRFTRGMSLALSRNNVLF